MAATLVTGGQGFIGSALVRELLEQGEEVTVLDLPEPPFRGLDVQGVTPEVRLVEGDVSSPDSVNEAIAGIDRVFHLAAVTLVGQAAADPLSTYRTNVEGTWTVLEALKKAPPEAVVVASSDKAYGPSASLPYRESDELLPASPYEGSKAACDLIARSYGRSHGLPVVVTRLANVYGGGDLNFSRLVPELMAAAVQARAPRIRSDGSPRRDFLHVSDAINGYLAVSHLASSSSGVGEAFNVGTGTGVPVGELIEIASRVTGAELNPANDPESDTTGEIDEQFVDSSKLRELSDWRPGVGLEAGLEESYEWFASHEGLLPSFER